jgi:predicted Fe-Mo cluster-binding NifX family protein
MRIAVATPDDTTINTHFRTSDRFAVFDAKGDTLESLGIREYNRAVEQSAQHSHDDTLRLLQDCCAVICGGMGHRVAQDLQQFGIEPVVALDCDLLPQDAARQFVNGSLERGEIHRCCCEGGHHH